MADSILIDSDSDEESSSVFKSSSRGKRGTRQTSLKRKSTASEDTIPPQHNQNTRGRRGRGRGLAQATRKSKTQKSSNSSLVVVVEDNSLILEDSSCDSIPSPIASVKHTTNKTADLLKTTDSVGISLSEESTPVISKPSKTTKRGLARRHCETPPPTDSSTLPSNKALVYSQAVAEGFKSLLHGAGSSGSKTNMEDSGEHTTAERNETDSESGRSNVFSTLTESPETIRQRKVNLVDEMEKMETPVKIPSPSPPVVVKQVARSLNKKLRNALQALNKVKDSLDQATPQRKQSRRDSDVIIVGEETPTKQELIVKVRYLTKVHRIQMKSNEPFHMLANKLSQVIGESEHNLGLFLHDRSLEGKETPQSVKLSVADIIECHCIKVSEDSVSSSDAVELVIQCRNNKSKTTIIANKRRPLSDVIQKYAEMTNKDASSLLFSFDGEDIEPSDTPSKLEIEDHDVIDVIYV